jgi:UDP-3-O-[3-hydroxymyristoyl] glucosamine N-acyltransferase
MPRGIALPKADAISVLAARLGGIVDPQVSACVVERLCTPGDKTGGSELLVLHSARYLEAALASQSPVLCSEKLAPGIPAGRRWIHTHVMWAVAKLLSEQSEPRGRHPSARIHPAAVLAADVEIRAGAVIAQDVRIGAGCLVSENAVIYPGVELGARVTVGPLAVLGRPGFGWARGPDGALLRIPHRGGVVIGDNVEIGPLCTVDAGTLGPTRIENGAKLDAHVHVGHNVVIGANTMVAAQAGFAGSAVIGEGVLVGGQAGIADHARVGAGVRIAAQSGVIGDVPPAETVAGFPAVPRDRFFRAMAHLLKLPDLDRS